MSIKFDITNINGEVNKKRIIPTLLYKFFIWLKHLYYNRASYPTHVVGKLYVFDKFVSEITGTILAGGSDNTGVLLIEDVKICDTTQDAMYAFTLAMKKSTVQLKENIVCGSYLINKIVMIECGNLT